MRRPRLLSGNEVAVILLLAIAGALLLAGRQLYGTQAKAAFIEQVRAMPGHVDAAVLVGALAGLIVAGGFVLGWFRRASPLLFGAALVVAAAAGGSGAVLSFGRLVLREADGPATDLAIVAALAALAVAVYAAVQGWDILLRACAARAGARMVPPATEPGRPLAGLLTPGSMARMAAQLALQLANYAAAEAARHESGAAASSAKAAEAAGTAARDAELAQAEAQDWAAARTAQANASLAVRKATQG